MLPHSKVTSLNACNNQTPASISKLSLFCKQLFYSIVLFSKEYSIKKGLPLEKSSPQEFLGFYSFEAETLMLTIELAVSFTSSSVIFRLPTASLTSGSLNTNSSG